MSAHKKFLNDVEDEQRRTNQMRRTSIKNNITSHINHILMKNTHMREIGRQQRDEITEMRRTAIMTDQNEKKQNAMTSYNIRKEAKSYENYMKHQYD